MWPYTVNTAVSLDSGPITLIDLVDHSPPSTSQGPETVQSQVVWNVTGLTNTQHNLRISVGAGQPFAIVDALMYVLPPSQAMPIDYNVSIMVAILMRQMLAPRLPPHHQLPLYKIPSLLHQLQVQLRLQNPDPDL